MKEKTRVHIKIPVWKDRSISINLETILLAKKENKNLLVSIGAKPYNKFDYEISPKVILKKGKKWKIKGRNLLNFPISLMKIRG